MVIPFTFHPASQPTTTNNFCAAFRDDNQINYIIKNYYYKSFLLSHQMPTKRKISFSRLSDGSSTGHPASCVCCYKLIKFSLFFYTIATFRRQYVAELFSVTQEGRQEREIKTEKIYPRGEINSQQTLLLCIRKNKSN